jgi:sec-independent protein translocase protein TatB
MFDIGFPELIVVSIVALLVIGPDKLPETLRALFLWVGRLRRSLTNIRADIENEIGADDIRQQLHNESIMKELKETRQQLQRVVNQTDETLTEIKQASTALSLADTSSNSPSKAPSKAPSNAPSKAPSDSLPDSLPNSLSNTEPSRDPTQRSDARD